MLRLVAAIIIVEIGAALVYRLAGIGRAPPDTRFWFTLVWTLVTLAVVLTGLRRIRLTRLPPAGHREQRKAG